MLSKEPIARDMCLRQLSRYDGGKNGDGGMNVALIALRGEIFDVSDAKDEKFESEWKNWFGKNRSDVSEEDLMAFKKKFKLLGKVIEERTVSWEELCQSRGEKPGTPIYIAARGLVFDVSSGASFYGPSSSYHVFAGRNAQRALAKMSLKEDDISNSSLDDLDPNALKILDDWISRFMDKYTLIGNLEEEAANN